MRMKRAGIVGGIGPASTLDYYRGVIDEYRARRSATDYPRMVIDSLDLSEMYDLATAKAWGPFADRLVASIHSLRAAGADFAAMAANTAHIVFDEVAALSPLPLVSIVEETARSAQQNNCRCVIVLGTAFTMSSTLYTAAFAKCGIAAYVPTADEQTVIHGIIFPHLQEGIVLHEEKAAMLGIARRLVNEHRADALVLGCTELPLIIKDGEVDALLLDTTQIHIKAIVDRICT